MSVLSRMEKNFMPKIKFYRTHPVQASIDLLELDLPPVQRCIMRQTFETNYMIITAARGIGKTYLAAAQSFLTGILFPGSRILMVGPTFRHGKLMFMELERIYNKSKRSQIWVKKVVHQSDLWRFEFQNGSTIATMPLAAESQSSIRGFRAHRLQADEMPHIPQETFDLVLTPMLATMKDPMVNVRRIEEMRKLIKAGKAKPGDLTLGDSNKMWGFTSAYYKFNHVYSKIAEFERKRAENIQAGLPPMFDTKYYSYLDAPSGFTDLNAMEMAKHTMPDFQFRMEWLSEWQNDSGGFYPARLVASCVGHEGTEYWPEIQGDRKHPYFMGIDPARTVDNFAISIAKFEDGVFKLVRVVTFRNKNFDLILMEFRKLMRAFPGIQAVYMDNGGGGLLFKDMMGGMGHVHGRGECVLDKDDPQSFGKPGQRILHMVQFNPTWSETYNFALKGAMERGDVHFSLMVPEGSLYIPTDNPKDQQEYAAVEMYKLGREMQNIQITSTSGGNLRFDGPKKTSETDRFTSLLLAFAACQDTIVKSQPTYDDIPMGGWAEDMATGSSDGLEADGVVVGD